MQNQPKQAVLVEFTGMFPVSSSNVMRLNRGVGVCWQSTRSLKWWTHDFHIVRFHQRAVCLCIHTLSFLEHLLKPAWRHTDQQDPGLGSDILKGVRASPRYKHNRPSRGVHDTVAYFEL